MMKKLLLPLLAVMLAVGSMKSQTIYEDFANGVAKQPWAAIDTASGAYLGVVANPRPDAVNPNPKCGAYRRGQFNTYSLLWTVHTTDSFDLSVNNKFKVQIYSPIKSEMILKFEGGENNAFYELKRVRLSPAKRWVEYTFDLSSVKNVHYKKIDLFFAPGTNSKDTFYFGRIAAFPADACSVVAANPQIIDDFECQRNASYDNGYDSLSVVANPDKTGINTSAFVGKYNKPPHQPYDALVADYANPIDLSKFNYLTAMVWSPVAGNILGKLEGSTGPTKEIPFTITPANVNKWVQVSYDFSKEAFVPHSRVTLFFDAGHDTAAPLTFYVDNIQLSPPPPLEDFDPTKLTWGAGDAQNGTFSVVANPTPAGINTSPNVGFYTKGSSPLGVLSGSLPATFAVTTQAPQMNVQVLAPAGAKTVTMQLVSATQGSKTADAPITSPGTWETLAYDFSSYTNITDFSAITFIFDKGVTSSGAKFYFDNISQSASTLNPCKGTVADLTIVNDFECQQNDTAKLATADLLSTISIIPNPYKSSANASDKVIRYVKTPKSDLYNALTFTTSDGKPYDLSIYNQLSVQVWSSKKGAPIGIKMEGGTGGLEKDDSIKTPGAWQTFVVDFSSIAGKGNKTVTIFGDLGVIPNSNDTFYFDNIIFKRAAITGCAIDFQKPGSSYTFTTFANGSLSEKMIPPVANPSKTGIDTSSTVSSFTRAKDGDPNFAGETVELGAPLNFKGAKTISMKVYMPKIGNVSLKLEHSLTGATVKDGPAVPNTKVNVWEQLTFDFSGYPIDTGQYSKLTIFFDFYTPTKRDSTKDVTYYFDDIVVGAGSCTASGLFEVNVEKLNIYPNPAYNELTIDAAKGFDKIVIFNRIGQAVKTVSTSVLDTEIHLNVGDLQQGMYFLAAYKKDGSLAANAKFLKE